MKQYIGTKLIKAEPALRINKKLIVPADFDTPGAEVEEGYKVIYQDGYESWSPKEVFERSYLPMTASPNYKTNRPSVSLEMVEDFIAEVHTETMGDKCTVVRAVLRNGFELVESSACVSPENYSEDLGRDICLTKIKDKVWELLGFLLQTAVYGVR